jgi:uncharacterized protein
MAADHESPRSTVGMSTITVQGQAAVRAEPDEATVWITLSALDGSPGKALADVAARTAALVALLDQLEVPKADRSTSGVTVGEDFEHTSGGRRSLGHRALASVQVRFTNDELVGQLITRAGEEIGASIDGPSWFVSLTNPVRLEAAREAAANARTKAEAFAAGVEAELGRLLELNEPDGGHRMPGRATKWIARAASGGGEMPIEAGELEVIATIDATFELKSQ